MSIPIISVTGTKGKTTVVGVIADVLQTLQHNVLKVDTRGHFVNGEQRSSLDDSKRTWRLVPSVCPGRYLWEFHADPALADNGVAVLECSLGCSASSGLGYRYHKVGVFLNVFEDHLGSSDRLTTKADIARAKSFVFSRLLREDACAVFNADDPLVCRTLKAIPDAYDVRLLPCGHDFSEFALEAHLAHGGAAITTAGDCVVLRRQDGDEVLFDLRHIPWTFDGQFKPSVWNLMQAAGAVIGYYGGKVPVGMRQAFEACRLDPYGGRLTVLRAGNGVSILADYAHEKVSLQQVGDLARTMVQPGGRVIAVVRLAHDRTDELIRQTGQEIAGSFDNFIVYDKIDGHLRQPRITKNRFPEIVGRTSELFAAGIQAVNPNVERMLREDQAIARAADKAQPGDVVVVIVNDDIARSIGFIQASFKADFA